MELSKSKKILGMYLLMFVLLVVSACGNQPNDDSSGSSSSNSNSLDNNSSDISSLDRSSLDSNSDDEVKATFTGTIVKINNQYQSVQVDVEEGGSSLKGEIITVDISVNDEATFEVGNKVEVGFDGSIQETSPLGIGKVFYVELIEKAITSDSDDATSEENEDVTYDSVGTFTFMTNESPNLINIIELREATFQMGTTIVDTSVRIYYGVRGGILEDYVEFKMAEMYTTDNFRIEWQDDECATVYVLLENEDGEMVENRSFEIEI